MSGLAARNQESRQHAPVRPGRTPALGWRIGKSAKRAIKDIASAGRRSLFEATPAWVQRICGPAVNYLDMLLLDHGIFRLVYLNRHRLGAHAWRSAQPAPHDIGAFARQGLRSIVNLRGERLCGSYWLERAACARHGISLHDFPIRSRTAPTRGQLMAARDLFERIEYPVLMHCKSGADRVGLMSVLYRHLKEGVPLAVAKRELSLRYGHLRQAETGILDHLFDRYIEHDRHHPMAFFDWVERVYDPADVTQSFRSKAWANQVVDHVLARE